MVKRTGPTNPELQELIRSLKTLAIEKQAPFYKRLANELSKSTRERRTVNLSRINRYANEGETIVVPGKVLGTGNISKKLNVSAWDFSDNALSKLHEAGSKTDSITNLKDIKNKKVRIMG